MCLKSNAKYDHPMLLSHWQRLGYSMGNNIKKEYHSKIRSRRLSSMACVEAGYLGSVNAQIHKSIKSKALSLVGYIQ